MSRSIRFALLLALVCAIRAAADDAAPLARGPAVSFDEKGAPTVELTAPKARKAVLRARWKDASARSIELASEGARFKGTIPAPRGTVVDYEVLLDDKSAGKFRLSTLPAAAKKWTFCALGDTGWPSPKANGAASEEQQALARLLASESPDLVLHTGDTIYAPDQAAGLDPLFFKPYRDTLARVPFFCCLGNHDLDVDGARAELAALPFPPRDEKTRYYSFDVANAHFVALDSTDVLSRDSASALAASAQGRWLAADLAAARTTFRIAFLHHPLYSCLEQRKDERAHLRAVLEPILDEGRVDLVLAGHDHFYHRTGRVLGGKADEKGAVHVVTGGGGARLYDGKPDDLTACYKKAFNLVRVRVTPASLELETLGLGAGMKPETIDSVAIKARKAR